MLGNVTKTLTSGNPQDDFRTTGEINQINQNSFMMLNEDEGSTSDDDDVDYENGNMELVSLLSVSDETPVISHSSKQTIRGMNNHNLESNTNQARSRQRNEYDEHDQYRRNGKHRRDSHRKDRGRNNSDSLSDDVNSVANVNLANTPGIPLRYRFCSYCCFYRNFKSTLQCMNLMARILLWATAVALVVAVIWYSYELHNHG
jgi:hypothetical protein